MKIYIKNMVCDRCRLVIQNVLDELNLNAIAIHLGEIDFANADIGVNQLAMRYELLQISKPL